MQIRTEHITGFVVGLGAAAVGFYYYKKNQSQVDAFLSQHGIDMPVGGRIDPQSMTLEQLVAEKEGLEDLIAEREYAVEQEQTVAAEAVVEPDSAKPAKKPAVKAAKS